MSKIEYMETGEHKQVALPGARGKKVKRVVHNYNGGTSGTETRRRQMVSAGTGMNGTMAIAREYYVDPLIVKA